MAVLDKDLSGVLVVGPEKNGDSWSATYHFTDDFVVFSGHFPDYKILPAFIQVHMARHLLGTALGESFEVLRVINAKFTGQVRPGDNVRVECTPFVSARDGEVWECSLAVCPLRTEDRINEASSSVTSCSPVAKFRIQLGSIETMYEV